jgi:hypothetical protein
LNLIWVHDLRSSKPTHRVLAHERKGPPFFAE